MKKIFIILFLFLLFYKTTFSEQNPNGEILPGGGYIGDYVILKDIKFYKEKNKITFSDSIVLNNQINTEKFFYDFENFKKFIYDIEYILYNFDKYLKISDNKAYYFEDKYLYGNKKENQKYSLSKIHIQKGNLNKEKNIKEINYIAELTCDKNGKIIIDSGKYKNFPAGPLGNSEENFYKYFKNCDDLENFFDGNKRFKLSIDSSLDIRFILFSIIFSIILFYIFLLFIFYKILKKILIKKI